MLDRGAGVLLLLALIPGAAGAEVCRFAGTASHAGRAQVRAEVSEAPGGLVVDVTVALHAVAWATDVQYFTQEVSTWRSGEVQRLAVNTRTVMDGRVTRQQWDMYVRGPAGLQAYRVQARTAAEFQRRHPAFARHWPLPAFGQPWLAEYDAAVPERRPDLDLPAPPGLRPPLALAFYWSRFLPPGGGSAAVALPGFKRDKTAIVPFAAATDGATNNEAWRRWAAPLRHPALSQPSTAAAWVSPDHYLLQLAFEVRAPLGAGQGVVRAEGCQGVQVPPEGEGR